MAHQRNAADLRRFPMGPPLNRCAGCEMSNLRASFETFTADHHYLGGCSAEKADDGRYSDVDMQIAWEVWIGSIDSFMNNFRQAGEISEVKP